MRKTLLLTVGFCSLAAISHAQISKGTLFLGGMISVNTNDLSVSDTLNSYTQKNTNYTFAPGIGITVKDNNVVGFSLNYSHQGTSYSPDINHTNAPYNAYGGGFYYRKYINLSKQFYFFYEENLFVAYHSQEYYLDYAAKVKNKNTGWQSSLDFYPGISYRVKDRFFLEAGINSLVSIGSSTSKTVVSKDGKFVSSTKNSTFGADYNFSRAVPLTVGFRLVLGNKHRA